MPKKRNNMQRRADAKKPKLAHAADAFITANEIAIGALAWVGFQQEGRGFVLVAIEEDNALDASYIGERDALWEALQPNFPEIETLIRDYDPNTQLVLVKRVPDYTEMGVATFDVPPPVAHVKHQHTLG